jgi:hypothetical protein
MKFPFNFTQSTPASTWNIAHNLGYKPATDIVVLNSGSNIKVLPVSVVHTDDNNVVITFSSVRTGTVRLA